MGAHHEINTHTHLRVGKNELRLTLTGILTGEVQGINHLLHLVAVHLEDLPSEGLVFGTHVAKVHHVVGGAVNLFLVVVNDGDEVVNALGRGIHGGFPNLAFLLLAVAHKDENKVIVAIQPFGLCRTNGHRQALTE